MQHLRNNSTVFEELEVSIVDLTVANAVLLATRREKQEARQQIDSQWKYALYYNCIRIRNNSTEQLIRLGNPDDNVLVSRMTCLEVWFMFIIEFNATFNNSSVISWWSVLLVEETGVPGENHRPAVSHWQTWSHNVVSSTPRLSGIRTHNVSV